MKNTLKLFTGLVLISNIAYSGELYKNIAESPEVQDIAWTQRSDSKKTSFEIKPKAVKKLFKSKKQNIKISFLIKGKKTAWHLKLSEKIEGAIGKHYEGASPADEKSFASISVFEDRIEGVLGYNGKSYNLSTKGLTSQISEGEMPKIDLQSDAIVPPSASSSMVSPAPSVEDNAAMVNADAPVRIGIEVDYAFYLLMGKNEQNLRTLVETVASARNAYYANEGILMQVSGIKVWKTEDPYSDYTGATVNSTQTALYKFVAAPKTNGAHLMELLTSRPGWGGIAFIQALGNPTYFHSVSSIYTTYNPNSVYNWPLNVMVHEIGHNLGSRHTHSCSWTVNGTVNQAIDGCWQPEGTCPRPVNPPNFKGTVMSYCHMSNTMDLSLGFGPLPKQLIRQKVIEAIPFLKASPSPTPKPSSTPVPSPTPKPSPSPSPSASPSPSPSPSSFRVSSFSVGQNKTVKESTKRNWVDLTLAGVVGVPTFQAKARSSSSWSTKSGADALNLGNNVYRIFFYYANTDYDVRANCSRCSPVASATVQLKTLP